MPDAAFALPAWIDPAHTFAGLAARHPHVFWLDAGPHAVAGWSFLGVGEPADEADVRAVVCGAMGSGEGGRADAVGSASAGPPFRGGWVGMTGYEAGAARAGAPVAADPGPSALWLRVTRFASFDHARRAVSAHAVDAAAWTGELQAAASTPIEDDPLLDARVAASRSTPEGYADLVERCRVAIAAGDAYQLCLTTRFTVPGRFDAVAVHRALRAASPSHHGGIIRSGDVALVSATPERFLEVRRGVARTRPIKGTRPRGADADADALLAAELLASEKERAENVMIVDLMRNDLAQVCDPATVAVERLLEVESYPAVHQLVSTVAGRLSPDTTVGALLDAAFPAGSMTGAPKLSAMSLLHELERAPRGMFAGAFGWVGTDGALDLAMVIRSILVAPDEAWVGAGGGITWRSDAAAEVAEVGLKARAPLAALGARLPPGW